MSDRTREMATVRENSRILDGYYKMTLHAPVIAQRCRPGQFVFIRVGSGTAPLLRRPISICEADSIGGTIGWWAQAPTCCPPCGRARPWT